MTELLRTETLFLLTLKALLTELLLKAARVKIIRLSLAQVHSFPALRSRLQATKLMRNLMLTLHSRKSMQKSLQARMPFSNAQFTKSKLKSFRSLMMNLLRMHRNLILLTSLKQILKSRSRIKRKQTQKPIWKISFLNRSATI